MGTFDTIYVEEGVQLPHFPDSIDHTEIGWQSKRGLGARMSTFRITSEGRLKRKEKDWREKTEGEKQAEAAKWGFDSWKEYVEAYEESDGIIPDVIDYDVGDPDSDVPPAFIPKEKKVASIYWADHNMHGSFEFHHSMNEPDVYVQYEARFTEGDLDEIILDANRGRGSREELVEALEAYDEGK